MVLAARYSLSFCLRNNKKGTAIRLVVSVLATVMLCLSMWVNGRIFNAVQVSIGAVRESHTFTHLVQSGLIGPLLSLFALLFAGVALGLIGWFYRQTWAQSLRFANQRELNNHRATLDVARFRSKEFDDLQKRIQELPMSWHTRIYFSEEMFSLFTTLVSFGLFGASLLWYNPFYAFVLVLTALPMMVVEFRLVALWWTLFQELVPCHKQRGVLEKPYHMKTVFTQALMFNQMPALRQEIDVNVGRVLDQYNNIRKITVRKEMCTHLLAILGLCGVITHAIWTTVMYTGEIGTLTIIMASARTFQANLESIVSLIAEQWNSAKGVILIEKDFFGMKPVLETKNPVVPKFDSPPTIRFDNVSFAYPGSDTLVLQGVSFSIESGATVAIVGNSGNGKSTLQALLMRHYDPTSGVIYANGIDLRNIEPKEWNGFASALTQEYVVLERPIGQEIASSRLGEAINQDYVEASSKFAHLEGVVSDKNGFQTQIGTEFGGCEFSGGERKRLALARVHYRGTPILILDEPDSSLDPDSAQRVIDNAFALEGRTVVIITHHVSRAERCDWIIVMGKGTIVEQGKHEDLMALNGVYASMHKKDQERIGSES